MERTWKERGNSVESAWKVRGNSVFFKFFSVFYVERAWKVRGKYVEIALNV